MLTQLLARRKSAKPVNPLIEVISSDQNEEQQQQQPQEEKEEEDEEEEDFDWEQTVPDPNQPVLLGLQKNKYGFNKQYSDFFEDLQEDLSEIVLISNPDETPSDVWRSERTRKEDDKFDPDHYMADFMMDTEVKEALAFKTQAAKDLRRKLVAKKKRNAQSTASAQSTEASATDITAPAAPATQTQTLTPDTNATTQPITNATAQPTHDETTKNATQSQDTATSTTTPNETQGEIARTGVPSSDATPTTDTQTTKDATRETPQTPAQLAFLTPASLISLTSSISSSPSSTDTAEVPQEPSSASTSSPSISTSTTSTISTPTPTPTSTSTSTTSTSSTSTSFASTSSTSTTSTTVTTSSTATTATSSSSAITKQQIDEEAVPFSDENKEVLMRLPNKECITCFPLFFPFPFFYLITFKILSRMKKVCYWA